MQEHSTCIFLTGLISLAVPRFTHLISTQHINIFVG